MKSEEYPDYKMYNEIMQCSARYVGVPLVKKVREFEVKPYPQRLFILSDLIKQFILREIGDIKHYFKLDKEIGEFMWEGEKAHKRTQHDDNIHTMIKWLDYEMHKISITVPQETDLIISMLVWGSYADKMLNTTFKSLLSEGNLPFISKKKDITIFIQTDKETRELIENHPITKKIKELKINIEYAIIPGDLIMKMVNDMTTYWMVGAAASLAIHYAKHEKSAFHHSYPDIVYSENYFKELLKLTETYKNILVPGARSDEGMIIHNLKTYETEDSISIPAADLVALHLNCNHIAWWGKLVNNRENISQYPLSHTLMWESEDTLYFNSPHLNAAWIDYETLKDLPRRYFMTLDSELERICLDDNFYIPQHDDLYLLELSAQGRTKIDESFGELPTLLEYIWNNIGHKDQLKFAIRGMAVPINRKLRPLPENHFLNKQVKNEQNTIFNTVIKSDPYKDIKFPYQRMHVGCFADCPDLIPQR